MRGWLRRKTPTSPSPDGRLLRGVRLRLIAWSAGSTFVVLAVLGATLYLAVAGTLAAQSTDTLRHRIDDSMRSKIVAEAAAEASASPKANDTAQPAASDPSAGPSASAAAGTPTSQEAPANLTRDASEPGYVFGGPSSGTLAFALNPDSTLKLSGNDGQAAFWDIPEPAAAQKTAALAGQMVVWEGDLHGTPARFVLEAIATAQGPVLVESIGDRTSEVRLLQALLFVLLAGSLVVVAASVVFGYFYAGRALVPIRGSLQRQRDFAADASHELRTPLAIVRGALEELRTPQAAPDRERSIADIEAGTERLGQLVDDLLLLARADSGAIELRREPVDLAEIATDTVARFARAAAERDVRLRLDVVPAPVVGDADRLGQVVGILIDNALKHSPAGGVVAIRVRDGAKLVVEDEGPGIRGVDLPRLFDRFWRAPDAPPGGTGLGLSIAAWIVGGHGGGISAANREAGGARFEVEIPELRPQGRG